MYPEIEKIENLLGTPFLQTILDSSSSCIILAEAQTGKILFINEAVRKFRGETDVRLAGIVLEEYVLSWKDYFPNGILMKNEEMPLARAILNDEVIDNEEVIVELDNGERRWALASAAPIKDANGKTLAGIVSWVDITDYKENQRLLEEAQSEIRTLRGILPLCSFCKKIRDDKGYWEQVDIYIHKHTSADISHSICPGCCKEHYPEFFKELNEKNE